MFYSIFCVSHFFKRLHNVVVFLCYKFSVVIDYDLGLINYMLWFMVSLFFFCSILINYKASKGVFLSNLIDYTAF